MSLEPLVRERDRTVVTSSKECDVRLDGLASEQAKLIELRTADRLRSVHDGHWVGSVGFTKHSQTAATVWCAQKSGPLPHGVTGERDKANCCLGEVGQGRSGNSEVPVDEADEMTVPPYCVPSPDIAVTHDLAGEDRNPAQTPHSIGWR